MKGLVFDLRFNPGGLLTAAVEVASRFVNSGPVVLVQEKNGRRAAIRTRRVQRYSGIPIVVLINESSASASEIVAGAIKDTKAGTLVGKHTFGKGLVQTLFPLANDTALRLTTAKYFTPSGRDINNKFDEEHRPIFNTGGIAPDIEVEQSKLWLDQDFEDTKNDTQLARAVAEVQKQMTAGVVSVRP
jgi:carboxyl-terminal processing protease